MEELKKKLAVWLQEDDYTLEESIDSLNKAQISRDGNTVTVTYSTGTKDIVELDDNGEIISIE